MSYVVKRRLITVLAVVLTGCQSLPSDSPVSDRAVSATDVPLTRVQREPFPTTEAVANVTEASDDVIEAIDNVPQVKEKVETDPPPQAEPAAPAEANDAMTVPHYWGFFGDSHTGGRELEPSAASPGRVFQNIWTASGFAEPDRVRTNGVSGRSLAGTAAYFSTQRFDGTPWIHVQESGNQRQEGQYTPLEFGATFETFWRAVHARFPLSLKSYETAHSFNRIGKNWRDWQTTKNWAKWGYASEAEAISYNDEMLRRIAILAEDDIVVIPVYTAEYIDALIARIPGGYPSIEDDSVRHYNGTGNFMIALAKFKALGYAVDDLDFSTVTIHEDPAIDTARKALCVDVINTAAVP